MLHLEVCKSLDSEEHFGSLRIFQEAVTFAQLLDLDHTLCSRVLWTTYKRIESKDYYQSSDIDYHGAIRINSRLTKQTIRNLQIKPAEPILD